jgi:hypothetical protein
LPSYPALEIIDADPYRQSSQLAAGLINQSELASSHYSYVHQSRPQIIEEEDA